MQREGEEEREGRTRVRRRCASYPQAFGLFERIRPVYTGLYIRRQPSTKEQTSVSEFRDRKQKLAMKEVSLELALKNGSTVHTFIIYICRYIVICIAIC